MEHFKTLKEIIGILEELEIRDFELDSERRKVCIQYWQDSEKLLARLNQKSSFDKDSYRGLPFANHWETFLYKEWRFKCNIIRKKPEDGLPTFEPTYKPLIRLPSQQF